MKKSLIKLLTVSGVFFLTSGLVACGGGNEPKPDPEPDPDPTPVTPTVTKVEINFWHTFGQTIQDNLKPQLESFIKLVKKNENVDVTIINGWVNFR